MFSEKPLTTPTCSDTDNPKAIICVSYIFCMPNGHIIMLPKDLHPVLHVCGDDDFVSLTKTMNTNIHSLIRDNNKRNIHGHNFAFKSVYSTLMNTHAHIRSSKYWAIYVVKIACQYSPPFPLWLPPSLSLSLSQLFPFVCLLFVWKSVTTFTFFR